MKLTLLSHSGISNSYLPDKYVGRYWLRSRNADGKRFDVVSVEALKAAEVGGTDKWIIKSNRRFSVIDKNGKVLQNVPLEMHSLYKHGRQSALYLVCRAAFG